MFPRSFSARIVVAFACLGLVIGLISSWVVYERAHEQQSERLRTHLASVAATAAVAIDGDAFAALRDPAQQDDPAYLAIQDRLARIRDANGDLRFVYTMRRDGDGRVCFVVDAPAVDFDGNGRIDEDEQMAGLGEPYPEAAKMPALFAGFEHPAADRALTSDQWGRMLSGYAPIVDSQGHNVGLVGVDMMAGRLNELHHAFLMSCVAVLLAVGLCTVLLGAALSWRLVRPVRRMQRGLAEVEQGLRESLETDLGGEELRSLAGSFNALLESRRRMEGKLQESAKLEVLGQLSAAMAHDFANHLTVIATTAELLEMDAEDGSALQRRLLRIQKAAQGASAEVRRLLAFARRKPEQQGTVSLHEVVRAVVDLMQHTTRGDIEITTALEAPDDRLHGDAHALQSALLNLAFNARDAMPEGGDLSFATGMVEVEGVRRLRLTVRDTGQGMDEEVQRRLFEPFFTTKPSGRGTGLGMLAVRTTADHHGATLRVESAPGQGTTVTLDFTPLPG